MAQRIEDHPQQLTMDGSTRQQKLLDESLELLRIAEPKEGYYLATSFGKDSIATQRLCDEAGVRYDAHHNITGIDPPELVYFGRRHYPDAERHHSGTSMWALIRRKKMPPMRHARYCCAGLKEHGGTGRVCVMGMRASESDRRAKSWGLATTKGVRSDSPDFVRMLDNDDVRSNLQACAARGTVVVSPLYKWCDADLWAYIKDRKLPCCELYDQGFDRLGCIGCPMARRGGREREFDRWPGFKHLYIRAFDRLIEMGKFTQYKSGEGLFDWWMSDVAQDKPLEGQIGFEEALL